MGIHRTRLREQKKNPCIERVPGIYQSFLDERGDAAVARGRDAECVHAVADGAVSGVAAAVLQIHEVRSNEMLHRR